MATLREIKLLTISEFAHEIISENTLKIHHLNVPTFVEVLEQIWDLYPGLYHEENYDIYWRLSPTNFVRVYDTFSYFTALTLMAENTLCLLLRDSQPWCYGEPVVDKKKDRAILIIAMEEKPLPKHFTVTYRQFYKIVDDAKLEMTGDIMSYAHKDIYYLETKTKSQTSEDLVNLFASPAGRELVKYKPKAKTKYKANPAAMDFFAFKPTTVPVEPVPSPTTTPTAKTPLKTSSGTSTPTSEPTASPPAPPPRRRSLDLYNEAASILGLTCSQTNDCKCIECQCHYFDDYEDDLDFTTEGYTDHQSLCSIQ